MGAASPAKASPLRAARGVLPRAHRLPAVSRSGARDRRARARARSSAGGVPRRPPPLGPQPEAVRATRLFVVPNPSPANAHFTLADQTSWYDRLADFLA